MSGDGEPVDRGGAVFATAAALLVVLLLLLVAVQVAVGLHTSTLVTTAAHHAARSVAGYAAGPDRCAAVATAEHRFASTLGDYGRSGRVRLEWDCTDPDLVSVRVIAESPSILPLRFIGLARATSVDRTIEIRVERER